MSDRIKIIVNGKEIEAIRIKNIYHRIRRKIKNGKEYTYDYYEAKIYVPKQYANKKLYVFAID